MSTTQSTTEADLTTAPKTEEERLEDFPEMMPIEELDEPDKLKRIDGEIEKAPDIGGIEDLIHRMDEAESVQDWSFILSDYIQFGNKKLQNSIAIFNMNSATDCPNIGTDNCQVPKEACYAYKAENVYPQPLDYRRRQEYLWDSLDAHTWAHAFLELISRKKNPVEAIRFSEAGDFRHRGDIIKINQIAKIVREEADVESYTYTASNYLDWDLAEDFFVNASNDFSDYGDQRYVAVAEPEDIPEDGVWCPHDMTDGEVDCGDCRLCITGAPQDRDVYITFH